MASHGGKSADPVEWEVLAGSDEGISLNQTRFHRGRIRSDPKIRTPASSHYEGWCMRVEGVQEAV